jgi:cytochrome P450
VIQSPTETYPLTDPVFLENPYPVYRRMRQQDPVYWSDALGHWVLTRHDDVLAATRNPALSSARTEVFVRAQLRGSDPTLAADYTRIHTGMMLMKDGPDHHWPPAYVQGESPAPIPSNPGTPLANPTTFLPPRRPAVP